MTDLDDTIYPEPCHSSTDLARRLNLVTRRVLSVIVARDLTLGQQRTLRDAIYTLQDLADNIDAGEE